MRGKLLLLGVGVTVVAVGLVVAPMWPRDDVPDQPDAVVVLGGAGEERAVLGLELRDRHGAELILSSSAAVFGERLGATCGLDARCIDPQPENTIGEARLVAEIAEQEGWGEVVVATSRFHTTRTRLLFRQCLGDRVRVVGAPRPEDEHPVTVRQRLRELGGAIGALTVRRAC